MTLRILLGASLLTNVATIGLWNDAGYEHTPPTSDDIDEVNRILTSLECGNTQEVYKAVTKMRHPAFASLKSSYEDDFETFQSRDIPSGCTPDELTVFHNNLSTQRTCEAFFLRNGAYSSYFSHQFTRAFKFRKEQ